MFDRSGKFPTHIRILLAAKGGIGAEKVLKIMRGIESSESQRFVQKLIEFGFLRAYNDEKGALNYATTERGLCILEKWYKVKDSLAPYYAPSPRLLTSLKFWK